MSNPTTARQPWAKRCIHLGDQTNTVGCPKCGPHIRIWVFQCAEHQHCTLARDCTDDEGTPIQNCMTCPDYQPR
jgi:hypothetical protein